MHFEQAKNDILNWVTGFIEKPHAQLNNWPPCPYARKARLDGQFDIRPGQHSPYQDLASADMGDKMVIAYVYDPAQFEAHDFVNQVTALNRDHLVPRNIIALSDHPGELENVNGVIMNQGTWAIVFIQPLDKLDHFARLIAGKGYYDGWPEDYLEGLFEFRKDPRQ